MVAGDGIGSRMTTGSASRAAPSRDVARVLAYRLAQEGHEPQRLTEEVRDAASTLTFGRTFRVRQSRPPGRRGGHGGPDNELHLRRRRQPRRGRGSDGPRDDAGLRRTRPTRELGRRRSARDAAQLRRAGQSARSARSEGFADELHLHRVRRAGGADEPRHGDEQLAAQCKRQRRYGDGRPKRDRQLCIRRIEPRHRDRARRRDRHTRLRRGHERQEPAHFDGRRLRLDGVDLRRVGRVTGRSQCAAIRCAAPPSDRRSTPGSRARNPRAPPPRGRRARRP